MSAPDRPVEAGAEKGYVSDIDFVDVVHPRMAPVWLDYVAALQGVALPAARAGFDYCDLGCGTGLAVALLAASDPRGRFIGVDISPSHIARARQLVDAGQLANLALHETGFANAINLPLPDFDYIALYGILSWIGPAERRQALEFVRAKLKPGGLVLVSYNVMPGMAALEPLRRLMTEMAGGRSGDHAAGTPERLAAGLAALRSLKEAGLRYFMDHAPAARAVDAAFIEDRRYLAHEYLNPHWHLPDFADMRSTLAEIGLDDVGSMVTETNSARLSVPRAARKVYDGAPGLDARELIKDLALDRSFRVDLFGRALRRVAGDAQVRLFDTLCFSLGDRDWRSVPRRFRFPAVAVDRREAVAAPLLQALAEAPASLDELAVRPGLDHVPRAEIVRELSLLVAGHAVHPARAQTHGGPARMLYRAADRFRLSAPLSASVLDRHLSETRARFVAARALGAPLEIGPSDAVLLLGVVAAGIGGAAAWAAAEIERRRMVLAGEQGPIRGMPALTRHLQERIDRRWKPHYLERLVKLGVIVPAGTG